MAHRLFVVVYRRTYNGKVIRKEYTKFYQFINCLQRIAWEGYILVNVHGWLR